MDHRQAVQSMAAERYLLEEMSELERHAFEDHFFSCAECADEVRAGAMLRAGIKEGLTPAAVESKPIAFVPRASRTWKPSVLVPWAAAATLALIVGYQSSTGRSDALGPGIQSLAPVALRPSSRGAELIIPRSKGAATLALDVNTVGITGPLDYELADSRGSRVGSGTADLPTPGAPLLLLIPGSTLEPSGRYTLSVRAAGGVLVGEYRFAVAAE
jgi:hypothetical protein